MLVVDDDGDFLKGIIRSLKIKFTQTEIFGAMSGAQALEILKEKEIGVILTDLQMPGISGHDLLLQGLELNPNLYVVMITGHGTVENAVNALKKGAWDFIAKPVERETLYHIVEKAMEYYALVSKNRRLQDIIKTLSPEKSVHWESRAMKQLTEKISAIAVTDYTVLVTGESGCGKEYVAKMIHSQSKRKQEACHTLNCPAIPEPLLESELFGHVKGAFTGAERKEHIPLLVRDFINKTCRELGIPPMDIEPVALSVLSRQSWPGNVRELLNYVRRLVVFSNGKNIDFQLISLVEGGLESTPLPAENTPYENMSYKEAKKEALDLFSRNYLTRLFEQTRGNISETSRISGIERASIQKIIKRRDIDISQYRG